MNKHSALLLLSLLLTPVFEGCNPQSPPAKSTPPSTAAEVSPQTPQAPRSEAPKSVPEAKKPTTNTGSEPPNSSNTGRESPQRAVQSSSGLPNAVLKPFPVAVHGVFLTHDAFMKRTDAYWQGLKKRGVNALVVNVKDDSGYVYIDAKTRNQVQHVETLGFYTIARMVAFKDPTACKAHPNWVFLRSRNWLDPANPQVQQYDLGIARRAATLGVDEVQWDYVRYPDARISYSRSHRPQTISRFLATSRSQLHEKHVRVSADIFGLVTTASDDMGIGQLWESVSPSVDVLSPMVYPSHYGRGHYGLKSPVHAPYALIRGALKDAERRNNLLHKKGIATASIRPWLQDFDYKASYGRREIRAQIEACKAMGISSYLFWNASNSYTPDVSLR